MSHTATSPIEIRIRDAAPADAARLAVVAARDSSKPPAEPLLVAEVGGEIRAAISLADGSVVADPFQRTTELVEMLKIRAAGVVHGREATVLRLTRARRARLAFRSAA